MVEFEPMTLRSSAKRSINWATHHLENFNQDSTRMKRLSKTKGYNEASLTIITKNESSSFERELQPTYLAKLNPIIPGFFSVKVVPPSPSRGD